MDPSSRASSNTLSNAASTTDSEVRPLEPFDTLVDRYFQPNYTKSFKEITAERIASITIVIIKYWIPHYVKDPMKAEELIKILHNNPVLLSAVFETNWDQFDIISHYIKRNYNLSLVENIRIMPDTGALIQSWSANYEDPNDVLPYIYKKLANMCDSWNPNNYYYPGVAAVQTSGAGKSKTFCSLTKLGTYVVYCSFLSVESTGYPKRSPIADTLSAYEHSDQYEAQLSFLAFIAASVDAVTACVDLKIDPATFLRVQIEESDGTHVKPALTQWIRSRYIHHKDILTAFLTSLELETFMKTRMGFVSGKESKREAEPTAVKSKDEMAKPSQRFPKSMHAKRPRDFDINSFPIKTSDNVLDQSVESSMALEVLFVLDETRELLEKTCTQGNLHPVEKESIENELKNDSNLKLPRSRAISVPLFTCMRRAFRWIPKHSRIFAVTLDTTSRITNLAPPARLDHSERVVGEGRLLYRPIYLLATMDIRNPFQQQINQSVEVAMAPSTLFQYGRPLWFSTLNTKGVESTVLLASSKLLGGGGRYFEMTSDPTFRLNQLDCLSLLRARFPFHVCRSDVSSELVAGHLSWCVYISSDRYFIISTMPSEPVIADAATVIMLNPEHYLEMVRHFADSMSSGVIDPGQGGEVVAQFLLIRARDYAALQMRSADLTKYDCLTFPIKLRMFLNRLLGDSIVEVISRRAAELAKRCNLINVVEEGMIAFNHFCYIDKLPTEQELLMLYARGAALVAPRGQKGADLIIIYLLPDAKGDYLLRPENIGIMVIQVKNWKTAKDKHYNVSSTTKLSTSSIGLERVPRHMYLSFYMGLGGCYGNCEFPPDLPVEIDETEFQDISTKLKDYLTRPDCPQLYEQQLASLRKSDLSAQGLEIIRLNRQVSFSALGFSSQVYPCLREFDKEIPTRNCTTAVPSTQFPKKQWVKIWHAKRCPEESVYTTNLLLQLDRILKCFPDPVAYHSDSTEKQLIRRIAVPQYLAGLHPINTLETLTIDDDDDEAVEILEEVNRHDA